MDENMYFNGDKLLSYNCFMSIVVGERGCGKTYWFKDYAIKHFIKTHKKFCWIRRFASDLDDAVGNKKEIKFFKPFFKKYNYDYDITETDKMKNLYINDKICGYATNLRSAEALKGTEYNDVDLIIFDEFLVGDGGSHYIKNETMYLLSLIETIARLRKIRVILLGNASGSVINPYFDLFKLYLPPLGTYKTFKENTIVVYYAENKEYKEYKKQTDFGKMVSGTDYERFAINNEFIQDNNNFIMKRNPKSHLFCNIIVNNKIYGCWMYKNEMYISKKCNPNFNIILTFDYKEHNEKTLLLKSRSVFLENIVKHYQIGKLYFDDLQIKTEILDLLKRLHKLY